MAVSLLHCAVWIHAHSEELKFVHYSSKDGLPSSYIKDIVQDRYGFIWLANRENVCRFDGYNFKSFPAVNPQGEEVNLRTNNLVQTSDSLIVCKGFDNVYYYFDQKDEIFLPYAPLNDLGQGIENMMPTSEGFWYLKGTTAYFWNSTSKQITSLDGLVRNARQGHKPIGLIETGRDRVAFATLNSEVLVWDDGDFETHRVPFEQVITLMYFDDHDNLWVGSHGHGLCRIDLSQGAFEFYSSAASGNRKLLHNMVHTMSNDRQGRLWIGTEGGLCLWSPDRKIYQRSQHDLTNPDGLSSNPLYASLCDKDGNIWLGTYFSGINLWNPQNSFFKILPVGVCNSCLGGNAVSSVVEDSNRNIWIGLEDQGVNKIDSRTGAIGNLPIGVAQGGLSYGNVHDLILASQGKLWIATYTGGINIWDIKARTMQYVNTANTEALVSDNVYSFINYGDSIFISTANGINIYNKSTEAFLPFFPEVFTGQLVEIMAQTPGRIWFSTREGVYFYATGEDAIHRLDEIPELSGINTVTSDSNGRVWIGDSYTGLYSYDTQTKEVVNYSEKAGFPGNWIYSIQEGALGHIWVSTNKGLARLDPKTGQSVLYNSDSGVPFSQFNYRSSYMDSRGTIYFGSNQGLVYFNEDSAGLVQHTHGKVKFTGLKLFNDLIVPGESEESPLTESITLSDKIELEYEQNVFSIEFSAQNYGNQGKCHYAYYLDGFETNYNYVGNRNFATYTNLSPGKHTFRVKYSVNNTDWSEESTLLVIVHPPFWMSNMGYTIYVVLIAGIFTLIYLVGTRIQKSKALVQLERNQRAHAAELHQIKLEFFTNISHELRTPLTLIIGPLSRLLTDEKVSPVVKNRLKGIELNAKRLLDLLNQLLDFRKMESGKLALNVVNANLGDLLDNLDQSFQAPARESDLRLAFDYKRVQNPVWIDPPKVEKILINLVSNAFKFTDPGGKIEVRAKMLGTKDADTECLEITVRDSGRGMEPRVVNKIFDRFYQSESIGQKSRAYFGSGIGLAFVHSLVELHKGTIEVKSKQNVGTIFKVTIPVSRSSYQEDEISGTACIFVPNVSLPMPEKAAEKQVEAEKDPKTEGKARILVVEDNQELIGFIAGTLGERYTILTASNGAEALEQLEGGQVDLILSDVMMPVMDGFEFTAKVKSNFETSHIPVILLTAKSGTDNRFQGLKTGADYYIEKPFMAHILEQNIFNVLNTRRNLIQRFKRDAMMPVAELTHSDSDKTFINKLTEIIKSNIDKQSLDINFLTSEMGVSRSMLHIKLKKIAECSTTEFVNTIRLKEAVRLMVEKKCNVSEAAYQTGFSSSTYFNRRFKQYYGQSPRDFLHKVSG